MIVPITRAAMLLAVLLVPAAAGAARPHDALVAGEGPALALQAPKGWTLDPRCGAGEGIPLALYPEEASWQGASRVLYVLTFERSRQRTLAAFVEEDVRHFRLQSPEGKVREGAPLEIHGIQAVVREFVNDRWGNHETAAYLETEEGFAMVVLSARDPKSHAAGREAFNDLAKSIRPVTGDHDRAPLVTALRDADRNQRNPEGERFAATLKRELASVPAVAGKDCAKAGSDSESRRFSLILRLAADGAVEEVLTWPETRAAKCVRDAVLESRFSRPPEPAYRVRVDLAVSD